MLRRLGIASLALFVGCSSPRYQGPVRGVPVEVIEAPVDACPAFTLEVTDDEGPPLPAKNVTASCADPAICSAIVQGSKVLVRGRGRGTTGVSIAFDHPAKAEHKEANVMVRVKERSPVDLARATDPPCPPEAPKAP